MMTFMTCRILLTTVLAAACFGPPDAFAQQKPSLGELAAREAQRRQAIKGTSKVLTNADLPRAIAPRPAPPAGAAAPGAEAAPGEETKPKDAQQPKTEEPAKDQAWWRQRMSQAREALRRNEMFAEALQTRINSLTNDFAARDDPFQRAKLAEDRTKALEELSRLKADIESSRKNIADIEEEARRAGVPPGWLR
jgi:hypothetical protein